MDKDAYFDEVPANKSVLLLFEVLQLVLQYLQCGLQLLDFSFLLRIKIMIEAPLLHN